MRILRDLASYRKNGRQKVFTDGRQTPIDRNDRARVMLLAQGARREGKVTRAAIDVLRALLYQFANLKDGRCFPSYERIADAAGCCGRTVGRCLAMLEDAGLISWVHRLRRVRERVTGLPGIWASTWRVMRTSNAYDFPLVRKRHPDIPTKGQNEPGTSFLDSLPLKTAREPLLPELDEVLSRWGKAFQAAT